MTYMTFDKIILLSNTESLSQLPSTPFLHFNLLVIESYSPSNCSHIFAHINNIISTSVDVVFKLFPMKDVIFNPSLL